MNFLNFLNESDGVGTFEGAAKWKEYVVGGKNRKQLVKGIELKVFNKKAAPTFAVKDSSEKIKLDDGETVKLLSTDVESGKVLVDYKGKQGYLNITSILKPKATKSSDSSGETTNDAVTVLENVLIYALVGENTDVSDLKFTKEEILELLDGDYSNYKKAYENAKSIEIYSSKPKYVISKSIKSLYYGALRDFEKNKAKELSVLFDEKENTADCVFIYSDHTPEKLHAELKNLDNDLDYDEKTGMITIGKDIKIIQLSLKKGVTQARGGSITTAVMKIIGQDKWNQSVGDLSALEEAWSFRNVVDYITNGMKNFYAKIKGYLNLIKSVFSKKAIEKHLEDEIKALSNYSLSESKNLRNNSTENQEIFVRNINKRFKEIENLCEGLKGVELNISKFDVKSEERTDTEFAHLVCSHISANIIPKLLRTFKEKTPEIVVKELTHFMKIGSTNLPLFIVYGEDKKKSLVLPHVTSETTRSIVPSVFINLHPNTGSKSNIKEFNHYVSTIYMLDQVNSEEDIKYIKYQLINKAGSTLNWRVDSSAVMSYESVLNAIEKVKNAR